MSNSETFKKAIAFHQSGNDVEADTLYREVLEQSPENADVNHNLGLLEINQGRTQSGLARLLVALETQPERPQFWISYITALVNDGQLVAASEVLSLGQQHGLDGDEVNSLEQTLKESLGSKAPSEKEPVEVSLTQQISKVLALYSSGEWDAAEAEALVLTQRFPKDVFGWKALGTLFAQQQRHAEAVSILRKALKLSPNDAEVHGNLGNALLLLGKNEEAILSFKRAINLSNGNFDVYYNLANAFKADHQLGHAIAHYRKAILINPSFAEAYGNLANALEENGALDESLLAYKKAIEIKDDYMEAHHNIALLFEKKEQYDEAIFHFRRATELKPDELDVHYQFGMLLERRGLTKEACDVYQNIIHIDASYYKAYTRLGIVYIELRNYLLAIANLSKSVAIEPEYAETHHNLGICFDKLTEYEMSIKSFKKVLELAPNYGDAYTNLGSVYRDVGDLDEALDCYDEALRLSPKGYAAQCNILFMVNYHPDLTSEALYRYYQEFESNFGKECYKDWRPHLNVRDPDRKLRVGYVSAAFCMHSCRYFLEPLLATHDKSKVEIYAYAEIMGQASGDRMTERYKGYADHWIPTRGLSDASLADRIRADEIDVLIDVGGHTGGNRLFTFARKPAPVSLHWLDFGYTTGLSAIDYYLTDEVTVPEGSEQYFAETPWKLPIPAFAYRPAEGMGEVGELPALRRGYITFGTLTRAVRLNYKVIRTWAEILKRVPGSRLIINSGNFNSAYMQKRIKNKFVALGIDNERVEVGCSSPPWDVLRGIDIGLDCFPHNSGTTLFEHLYMGTPFITLASRPSVGRLGASILSGVGHSEWIAESEEEYVAKAVSLSRDVEGLSRLRLGLRQEMESSPLMDEVGFTRAVEQAYREMWQRWCATPATQ